jgi:hypothetical protein
MFNGGGLELMGVGKKSPMGFTPDDFVPLTSIISSCARCGSLMSFMGNDTLCRCLSCDPCNDPGSDGGSAVMGDDGGGSDADDGGGGAAAAAVAPSFECCICTEEKETEDKFVVDGCGHELCTSCVEKLAANGRDMFNCPECRRPITNYEGNVAADKPLWAMGVDSDSDAGAAGDDIDDDQECAACGHCGTLLLCDVCDRGMHHACAGVDPANEPESWICPLCMQD